MVYMSLCLLFLLIAFVSFFSSSAMESAMEAMGDFVNSHKSEGQNRSKRIDMMVTLWL